MKKGERFKRVVVKIGTGVITSKKSRLSRAKVRAVVTQVAALRSRGIEVIIVTSGAIGAGMGVLKMSARPQSLPDLQACAAIGQSQLMKLYDELFKKRGYATAKMLLTQEDVADRKRYINAKNTLFSLIENGVVPIINENDTVATDEIRFGDNDRLSSLVASLAQADLLVMLSNTDGLYEYDKKRAKRIRQIPIVERITREIEEMALAHKSRGGSGGMVTKLQSAKMATSSGIMCVIANGARKDVLTKIVDGERAGTLFLPSRDAINAKKHWIAYTSRPQGAVKVDSGARDALVNRQCSLLSSGITGESGRFDAGAVVSIIDEKEEEFARGLTNYSSMEIRKIRGLKTAEIASALGHKSYDEVIHRDNLVIL